jgi:hypothetical protein
MTSSIIAYQKKEIYHSETELVPVIRRQGTSTYGVMSLTARANHYHGEQICQVLENFQCMPPKPFAPKQEQIQLTKLYVVWKTTLFTKSRHL